MAKTLTGYLASARAFLHHVVGCPAATHDTASGTARLLPCFADIISERTKWQRPREKRLPFTWQMFQTFHAFILTLTKTDLTRFLDKEACIFDCIRLGVFTGSRAGEYAQTVARRGEFSKVPSNAAAVQWRNWPIAFVADDLQIFDHKARLLPHDSSLFSHPEKAGEIHIRFRFDKSNANFTIRKFRRGKSFLCPVDAGISILRRAYILKIPTHHPIAAYRDRKPRGYSFLHSQDVIRQMRLICRKAYPDPKHYMHINTPNIVAHSNRVTAAVALYAMKHSIPEIAFRLRWKPESVEYYLRECSQMVCNLTAAAIDGAQCI